MRVELYKALKSCNSILEICYVEGQIYSFLKNYSGKYQKKTEKIFNKKIQQQKNFVEYVY